MTSISPTNVMALRNAILQRNAALRDVAQAGGPAATQGAQGAQGAQGTGAVGGAGASDFGSALKSALQEVNGLENSANDAAAAFERGDTTDIAAVMLAKQQASVGFEATLQVRNKLLSAYKDIMSMPV